MRTRTFTGFNDLAENNPTIVPDNIRMRRVPEPGASGRVSGEGGTAAGFPLTPRRH